MLLPELFRGFAEYRNVVQGVLMMLVIIYLPNGIADTLISFVRNRRVQRSISMSGSATAGAAANTP
jgi:branched-chain amino acid transport system permease protein